MKDLKLHLWMIWSRKFRILSLHITKPKQAEHSISLWRTAHKVWLQSSMNRRHHTEQNLNNFTWSTLWSAGWCWRSAFVLWSRHFLLLLLYLCVFIIICSIFFCTILFISFFLLLSLFLLFLYFSLFITFAAAVTVITFFLYWPWCYPPWNSVIDIELLIVANWVLRWLIDLWSTQKSFSFTSSHVACIFLLPRTNINITASFDRNIT